MEKECADIVDLSYCSYLGASYALYLSHNVLQSRRDDMFIEKMWMTPLEFHRNGIEDKHIVPTGLKSWRLLVFYKHSVPTGLKNTTHILQFTIMSDIVPKTLHTRRVEGHLIVLWLPLFCVILYYSLDSIEFSYIIIVEHILPHMRFK